MAVEKLDYKREYKDLYLPKEKPVLVNIPSMNFIMVDGKGEPKDQEYQEGIKILYSLTFTIKMSGKQKKGYFEYVVPPLEGLWWCDGGKLDWNKPKSQWLWTSMIRQPEFVTQEIFEWALEECKRKKTSIDVSKARFEIFTGGLCVQAMHIGAYDDEKRTIDRISEFIVNNQLKDITDDIHKHHEIYISDPRRTKTEKLKTVLRFPVEKYVK